MDIVQLITDIDAFVWGPPMIVILLGSHLFLTIPHGLHPAQAAHGHQAVGDEGPGCARATSASSAHCARRCRPPSARATSWAWATAILAGGPGAVLWMWLTGVFGMATKYAETFAAVKYRVKDHNGNMLGGAMYAWAPRVREGRQDAVVGPGGRRGVRAVRRHRLVRHRLGRAVQRHDAASSRRTSRACPAWGIGAGHRDAWCRIVIFGGVKVISKVCEKLVPFMAIAYAWGCVVIIGMNWEYVWPAICLIFECAFTPKAAFGGAVGSGIMMALQFGCARGLFSNESGLGSAPIVASAASTRNPARQALVSMTGTFWDTVVICALTGIVLVSTLIANPGILESGQVKAGADLTSAAFASIPYVGTPILVIGMILFAYSTILGWSYYGNRCAAYLFGKHAVRPYQVLYVLVAFLGAIGIGDLVWTISDITNALMAVPNIIVVLMLSGLIARETKHYVWDKNLDEVDETPIPVLASK